MFDAQLRLKALRMALKHGEADSAVERARQFYDFLMDQEVGDGGAEAEPEKPAKKPKQWRSEESRLRAIERGKQLGQLARDRAAARRAAKQAA